MAVALAAGTTAPERALIAALPARYPQREPIDDQRPWNDAFAKAMRLAHRAHTDDLEVRCILPRPSSTAPPGAVGSAASARPRGAPARWKVPRGAGTPSRSATCPRRCSIRALLHLVRASDGDVAASRGGTARWRPAARVSPDMGHLVHMPTHIDSNVATITYAMHWNQKAIVADRKFYDRAGPMNSIPATASTIITSPRTGRLPGAVCRPPSRPPTHWVETILGEFLRMPSPPHG